MDWKLIPRIYVNDRRVFERSMGLAMDQLLHTKRSARELSKMAKSRRNKVQKDVEAPEVTVVAFVPVIVLAVLVTRTTEVLKWLL